MFCKFLTWNCGRGTRLNLFKYLQNICFYSCKRVNCSVSQNFTLKTWVLSGFRFYWSIFYNQAIYHVLAAVLRDCIGKYTGACCSLPVSYFEQVLEEEQLSVTSQNKTPLTLPHTPSLFISLFFHFREFIWVAISDYNQTAQWFIPSFPLWDACIPST